MSEDERGQYDDLRDYFDRYRMSYPLGSAERERGGQVIELIDDVEKAERQNERLRKHARALEGVLRARTRMNEEIDRKLQELGLAGGEGDG